MQQPARLEQAAAAGHQCQQAQGAGKEQRQCLRTEALHQRTGHGGADRGADAVEQQQRAAACKQLFARQTIQQVRDRQGIQREGQTAEQEEQGVRLTLEAQRDQGGSGACGGDQRQRAAAVATIGQAADRQLQGGAADDAHRHEGTDACAIQPQRGRIHGAHAPERAQRQAGEHRAGGRTRRCPADLQQVHLRSDGHHRRRKPCRADRQDGQREQDRYDAEQHRAARRLQVEQQLAGRQGEQRDHHVHAKHAAAMLGRGLRVQPAFDHRAQSDQRHAGDHAQQHPPDRLPPQRVHQHRRRRERGMERESTDVADAPDQRRRRERTQEEADEVARHHQARRALAPTFRLAAHGQQRSEQAISTQQQRNAGEQGSERKQEADHGRQAVPGQGRSTC